MWKCPSLDDIPKTGNKECITLGKFVVNFVELFLTDVLDAIVPVGLKQQN